MQPPEMHPSNKLIPWLFVTGMAIVVIANACLIYFATSTWSGLAADHAYKRGLGYNRTLEAAARQDSMGWTIDVRLQASEPDGGVFVTASDAQGVPLTGLMITVSVTRPLGPVSAQSGMLRPVGAGRYMIEMASLPRGQWDARIEVSRGDAVWNATRRVVAQ